MDGKLLPVGEAAERLHISPSLIYELCAAGELTHVRIGKPGKRGAIRIEAGDLDGYLAGCKRVGRHGDGEMTYL